MIKPTILLVLTVTLIGYVFCIRCHLTNPKFCKSNGYHTFLNSAAWGTAWLFCATSLFWITLLLLECIGYPTGVITPLLQTTVNKILPNLTIQLYNYHLIQISVLALTLAYFTPSLLMFLAIKLNDSNKRTIQALAYRKIAHTDDSPEFTSIYYQSWDFGLPIAFTLSNKKVYIGYVFEGGQHLNDILVLPIRSGYRSEEKNRLEVITNYEPVWEELENEYEQKDLDLSKFYICLPIREIIHANLHNFEYKNIFEKHEINK